MLLLVSTTTSPTSFPWIFLSHVLVHLGSYLKTPNCDQSHGELSRFTVSDYRRTRETCLSFDEQADTRLLQ